MDSVNPASSAMSLYTTERSAQPPAGEEQNRPAFPVQQPPDSPRVNEGPSTVTTISAQAQQLAQAEQAADPRPTDSRPPPRNDAQPADNDPAGTSSQSSAQTGTSAATDQNNGRAFDDQSATGTVLRN